MQRAAGILLTALCGNVLLWCRLPCAAQTPPAIPPAATAAAMLEDIEHRSFNYFWATANPANGLVPDRYPTPSPSSIAAVGFALTVYPIAVERGYITRQQALARVRATLAFLHDAPQGPEPHGKAGFHGFFYHFLDMRTGRRYRHSELSTIDTALLMAGVRAVSNYFDRPAAAEADVRRLADGLYRRVDWSWSAQGDGSVTMGWTPEKGAMAGSWHGYNEGMLIYLLGLGSPSHPLDDTGWRAWTSTYAQNWRTEFGQTYLACPTLFVHQFTSVWVDPRGIRDDFMRKKGIDYFQNTRRATYANRAYAIANPLKWLGYGERLWGLTASDGPGGKWQSFQGQRRRFHGYAARGIGRLDDGTLAPNGPIGSIAFAPEIVLPAIAELRRRYGYHLYSTYGFLDAFNPSVDFSAATGAVVKGLGWFDLDYIGIDQGLIVAMIENYRSGLIWQLMRADPYLRRGLARAGFSAGWLDGER